MVQKSIRGWACAAGVALALGVGAGLRSEVSDAPKVSYGIILERNAFGLLDPPPPPVAAAPTNPAPPKSTVQLVGISSSAQGLHAMLFLPPAPPARTNSTHLRLSTKVDDEQQGIRVLEIDVRGKRVRIRNAGVEEFLDFQSNSVPLTAAALAPGVGGVPGGVGLPGRPGVPTIPTPGGGAARAGVNPLVAPGAAAMGGGAPGSQAVVQSGFSRSVAPSVVRSPVGANVDGVRTIPARSIRTAPEQVVPVVDPSMQRQVMEIQRQEAEQQGVPFPPPLPE